MKKKGFKRQEIKQRPKTDLLNAQQGGSSFMFNPAPVYKDTMEVDEKQKVLKKRKLRERKQLEKRAQLIEYMSSDDEEKTFNRKAVKIDKVDDDNNDYGLLEQIDQDIIGYFQVKGSKIVNNATKIQESTYSIGSLHLGAICDIGPNGNYLVVNFARNRKGFIDLSELRKEDSNVNGGSYTVGEYVTAKVLANQSQSNQSKIQLSILPEKINEGIRLRDIVVGLTISGIAVSQNDYGYQIEFGPNVNFQGFVSGSQNLLVGRVYLLQVESINVGEKMVSCTFVQENEEYQVVQALKKLQNQKMEAKWMLSPGVLWPCIFIKEVQGGYMVKLDKLGVIGYVFQDYCGKGEMKRNDRIVCRLINFDEHLRNIQFSCKPEHVSFSQFQGDQNLIGKVYNKVLIQSELYGGSYLIKPLDQQEVQDEGTPNLKQKKAKKLREKEQLNCFLHRNNLWFSEQEDKDLQLKEFQGQIGQTIERVCKIKEINYFDHLPIVTMKENQMQKQKNENFKDLKVGDFVNGLLKQVIAGEEEQDSLLLKISNKIQGVVPHVQISDYPLGHIGHFKIGQKLRARVLSVDHGKKSLILTLKAAFLQKDLKVIEKFEQIGYSDQLVGYVFKKLQNGFLIHFFQNLTGLLSSKEIQMSGQSDEDVQVGQTIKVYVKYVNVEEKKLLLSLRKIDPIVENETVKQFRDEKSRITQVVNQLQLPRLEQDQMANVFGKCLTYKIRKQPQISQNVLILDYVQKKRKIPNENHEAIPAHCAVLIKQLATDHSEQQLLTKFKQQETIKQKIFFFQGFQFSRAVTMPVNESQFVYVATKHVNTSFQQVHIDGQYLGYVVELNSKYMLVTLPNVQGQITGIVYLNQNIPKVKYMQSVWLQLKKIVNGKYVFELRSEAYEFQNQLCRSYFDQESSLAKLGSLVQFEVTLTKDYGVIGNVVGDLQGYSGFIMNQNLITKNAKLTCQVLDVDEQKKLLDLREVTAKEAQKIQKTQKNFNFANAEGQVVLFKDHYSIIRLKSSLQIGFVWNREDQQFQYNDTIQNIQIINQDQLFAQSQSKLNEVPIFIQMEGVESQPVSQKKRLKLVVGDKIKTTVASIKGLVAYVNIQNGTHGRIHKSQFDIAPNKMRFFGYESKFEQLEVGQQIECKILAETVKENKTTIYELSCLSEHLSLEDDQLDQTVLVSGYPDQDVDLIVTGCVKQILKQNVCLLQVEVSPNYIISLNGWESNITEKGEQLNSLEECVAIGEVCKVKLTKLKQHKYENLCGIIQRGNRFDNLNTDEEILYSKQIYRVVSHHESYVRVQLSNATFASIDITELSESWVPGLFNSHQVGQWGSCRVIYQDEKQQYWGSTREVFLNEKNWTKCLHPVQGSSLSYQKLLAPFQSDYDLRLKLYKNRGEQLQVGQVALGYVTGIIGIGVFVKISSTVSVLVQNSEISDHLDRSLLILTRPVLIMITNIKEDNKYQGTMRLSILKFKYGNKELKTGDIIDGLITNIKNDRAAIRIFGSFLSGELDKSNAEGGESEEGWWANKLMKIGEEVNCVVIGIRENRQRQKVVQLSNIQKLIATEGKRKFASGDEVVDIIELYESLDQLVKDYLLKQKESENQMEEEEEINQESKQEEQKQQAIEEEEEIQEEEEQDDDEEMEEEDEEGEVNEQEEGDQFLEQKQLDQNKLNSRAEYEKQFRKIHYFFFKRKILVNPNSSILWIEFIAFVTENEGIENARGVMERALRVINFENEGERVNLWTAYLNLEFSFGSEQHLLSVFKRGCNSCDPKQLYFKLIEIYRRADKKDLMVEIARQLVSKFKQSCKCWVELLQCLVEWGAEHQQKITNQIYSVKDTIQRAVQCLKKKKHPKLFASYGGLQFKHHQIEEAKTTFDTLLASYPSRTDIWGQYIDLAIKYCSKEAVRNILERALKTNKKPRKIKFFFKRYLEFETKYGNTESVEKVKQAAEKWVESYMSKQGNEQESQSDDNQA